MGHEENERLLHDIASLLACNRKTACFVPYFEVGGWG